MTGAVAAVAAGAVVSMLWSVSCSVISGAVRALLGAGASNLSEAGRIRRKSLKLLSLTGNPKIINIK